jgi:hypothetical protein
MPAEPEFGGNMPSNRHIYQAVMNLQQSLAEVVTLLRRISMSQSEIDTDVQNLTAVAQTLSDNDATLSNVVGQLQAKIDAGQPVDVSELGNIVSQLQTVAGQNTTAVQAVQALAPSAPSTPPADGTGTGTGTTPSA